MSIPKVKEQFTDSDFKTVARVLWNQTLTKKEIDKLHFENQVLDKAFADPKLLRYLQTQKHIDNVSQFLYFYILVQDCLLEYKIESSGVCNYVTWLLSEFSDHDRAFKIGRHDDDCYTIVTDIYLAAKNFDGERKYQLFKHLGNYSLWLSGLFPQFATRGGQSLAFYENMGRKGYLMASVHPFSREDSGLYADLSDNFGNIQLALNTLSTDLFV